MSSPSHHPSLTCVLNLSPLLPIWYGIQTHQDLPSNHHCFSRAPQLRRVRGTNRSGPITSANVSATLGTSRSLCKGQQLPPGPLKKSATRRYKTPRGTEEAQGTAYGRTWSNSPLATLYRTWHHVHNQHLWYLTAKTATDGLYAGTPLPCSTI